MAANRTTAAIEWRPEVNALTTPQSYRLLFLPRGTVGDAQLAAEIAEANPNFNEEAVRTILNSRKEKIQQHLLNGEQVVEENAFTTTLSLTGRLDSPDDPLPPLDECLHVRVYASPPFVAAVRQSAHLERLPMEKKLPLITTAQDTVLDLKDVLNPAGLLQLNGEDIFFDRKQAGAGECVIEGTAGGRTVQTRFGKIETGEIILMPELPAPPHPWNNEHTVSISTRYSERGTLRTGTYARMLRSPLTLTKMGHPNPPEVGILTGKESSPHVSVTGGSVSADETLRIQAVLDLRADALLFSLIDMHEGGKTGAAVTVTANGTFTLQGFSGSVVSSLNIRVNNYAALKEMIRSSYGGRVVDVLEVKEA
ncbi:MAG: hypothetical protein CDV28_11746 [Candidatus Electronema aureum]|uniref:Uncharacterized protein n=1 Tax=Candidatus Electronema aureum TaxID=2005002 RepID=A0A521G1A8_9BACT|nr:MAG: hypothetical protein CDV28_11746 [Candidatus Electronema aureum]